MRSQDWRSLAGYSSILERWQRLVHAGVMPSVLLLSGREGTGKSLLMKRFVSTVLCESKSGCGVCVECQRLLLGEHDEVKWLETDGEPLKVSHAEELREHFAYHAGVERKRIVAVVDIDLMTTQGVNGLLKTLEEPPEDALILMTTSRLNALLPTLRSRTTVWHLQPPLWEEVRHLVCEKASRSLDEALLEDFFRQTGYSVGDTLKLIQNEDEALRRDVVDFLEANHLREAWEVLQRSNVGKQRTFDLIRRLECDMNRLYRRYLQSGVSQRGLVKRRKLLQEYKKYMSGRHHHFNTQLFAEGIALSPLSE